MKKQMIQAILPLLIASSAHAELAWVRGTFWKAPYEKDLVVKVKPADPSLEKTCMAYSNLVRRGGRLILNAQELDYRRSAPEGYSLSKFSATFVVDVEANKKIIAEALERAQKATQNQNAQEPLPLFTQKPEGLIATMQPTSPVQVLGQSGSLLEVSKSVGLEPLGAKVLGEDELSEIKVFGRDAACDLLSGKAVLKFDSEAKVSLNQEDYQNLDKQYRLIEELTQKVFQKKKTPAGRAAIFGFRLPEILKDLRLDEDRQEQMVSNLTELLFDGQMQRTSVWTSFNGQPRLTIYGSSVAPIHVTVEK